MEMQFLSNKQHTNTYEALREFILPFYKSVTLTIHAQALLSFHNISRGGTNNQRGLRYLSYLKKNKAKYIFPPEQVLLQHVL